MPDWLRVLACVLFWMASMALFRRWLAHSRQRADRTAGNHVRHTYVMLIIGVAGVLCFAAVPVAAHVLPIEGTNAVSTVFFVAMMLLPAYLVADYRYARHLVSEDGMDFGRPTGTRLAFRWDEVRAIRYGNLGRWFKIELQSGEMLRVPIVMAGLPAFADQVLRHVPPARIERESLRMLERTARGDLPPVS
ncbi:hypothetical protein [Massilia sp.]|uniref:hypothetical protein n=1 Tax=Massilia sp. TaxID=1882437 RepID=UPI00391AE208